MLFKCLMATPGIGMPLSTYQMDCTTIPHLNDMMDEDVDVPDFILQVQVS